jgi:Ca2+-binding RTX toxin-like protein
MSPSLSPSLLADAFDIALAPAFADAAPVDMIVFTPRGEATIRSLTIVAGDEGRDRMQGGADDEALFGFDGSDRIEAGRGNDFVQGGRGFDWINGGHGADVLYGGAGRDKLKGKRGNDVLDGGDGRDKLSGGAGNDELTGGRGADKFIFTNGGGRDVITDFENGLDRLSFTRNKMANEFEDLTISTHGDGVKIVFGVNCVILEDVEIEQIDVSDFIF